METPSQSGRLARPLINLVASLGRPFLVPGVQIVNRANYWWGRRSQEGPGQRQALFPFTYWSPTAFTAYHAMFPDGVETFHAFVPKQQAKEIFRQVLCYSQKQGFMPVWCVIKQHRRDSFLLSYQVDGFSLELNYQRTYESARTLQDVLRHMIATVIEAGGRFYLAKDHFLTVDQYRQSVGNEAVDAFLCLKQRYDPEALLQSDLFRRVFHPLIAESKV